MQAALAMYAKRKGIPLDDVLSSCADALREINDYVSVPDLTPVRFIQICRYVRDKYQEPVLNEFLALAQECAVDLFQEEE